MILLTIAPAANKIPDNSTGTLEARGGMQVATGRVLFHFQISGRSEFEEAQVTFSNLCCNPSCRFIILRGGQK